MEATVEFGMADPDDRPKVFRVPDDSDVEDTSSDNDRSDKDGSIRNSSEILRNANMRPATVASQSSRLYQVPVDLTSNHYPLSNIRGDDDYTTNALPPLVSFSHSNATREVTYIDLSSPPPEGSARFSPISTDPEVTWDLEDDADDDQEENANEEKQEKDVDSYDSDVSDMESIDMNCRVDEPCPHSPRLSALSESFDDYNRRNGLNDEAMDSEEDEFEEHDEFEDRDDDYGSLKESSDQEDDHVSVTVVPKATSFGVTDNTHLPPLLTTMDEEVEPQYLASTKKSPEGPFKGNVTSASMNTMRLQFTPVELPKLTTPPWTQSYVLPPPPRLPSLTEAVYPLNPTSISPHSETVAEVLGAKTGKLEYFLARDENKKKAAAFEDLAGDSGWTGFPKTTEEERIPPTTNSTSPHVQPEGPTAGFTGATPSQSEPSQGEPPQIESSQIELSHNEPPQTESPQIESSQNEPSQNEPSQNTPSQCEPPQIESSQNEPCPIEESTNESTERLAVSEWAASGTQFLNSPHEEVMEPVQQDGPILDETSAYQFELSKKAAVNDEAIEAAVECQNEPCESVPMDICDASKNLSEVVAQSPALTPTKRKASEISELTAFEEVKNLRTMTREARKRYRQNVLKKSAEANANSTVSQMSDTLENRSPKRLRRVAEALGYAALGGVAVVSALIATAPTL